MGSSAVSKELLMHPRSYGPEQALDVSASTADQGLGDNQQEKYEDASDSMSDICITAEDGKTTTIQIGCLAQVSPDWCGMHCLDGSRLDCRLQYQRFTSA